MATDRGLSSFFQDAVWADSLVSLVLPELIENARPSRLLRVWSPACGTGEELFSVSLMLAEALPDADEWSIFLTGTDADDGRLTRARRAAFPEGALKHLSREDRVAFFRYNPNTRRYGLRQQFMRNAHFSHRALTDLTTPTPAPGTFDLVLCPDKVTALPREQQQALIAYYGSVLSERGVLVARKRLDGAIDGFSTVFHAGLLAHRRSEPPQPISSVPSSELPTVRPPASNSDWSRAYQAELAFAQQAHGRFHVPPGV
ncbi:MAG: CheR family methyltransferase [Polyangiaceae bacterium]